MVRLRQVFSPAFLIAALAASSWWQPAVAADGDLAKLSKLFKYSTDPGAADVGGLPSDTDLQTLLTDALTLANAGVAAATDALAGKAEAERLMNSLFMSPSESDLQTIQKRFNGVVTYLTSGGKINNGAQKTKPFLLYGDGWRIRQDMKSELRNADGETIPKADGSGNVLIEDDSLMVQKQQQAKTIAEKDAVAQGKSVSEAEDQYPYWSDSIQSYTFDKKWGDSPTVGVFDSGSSAIAFTLMDTDKALINLGPKALQGGRLHAVDVTAVANSLFEDHTPPTGSTITSIAEVAPQATAIFHELFHLVWGDSLMYPSVGEEYQFQRMTGYESRGSGKKAFTKRYAMRNPQSYAYAAYVLHFQSMEIQANMKNV